MRGTINRNGGASGVSTITRRAAVMTGAALMLPRLGMAQAAWPTRVVKIIVPLGPGSGADIAARMLGERLQRMWGKPVVIENRPGGNGLVAISGFLTANDDHTLFYGAAATFTVHPYQMETLPYDFKRDILPIAQATVTIAVVAVPASSAVNTMPEFVKWAKDNPGKLNAALVPGIAEITFDRFVKVENLQITKVPYRNIVDAVSDASVGRIQFLSTAFAIVQPAVEGGTIRVIAVTNSQRFPGLPDVATCAEQGVPSMAYEGLAGLFGAKLLSADLRERIGEDVLRAMGDPVIKQRIEATGQMVLPGGAAVFQASIDAQMEEIKRSATYLGLNAGKVAAP
jgi:tripartite-type tricarboxylate transporter receptor subunit TctC